ncbi:RNF213 [Mytilus edulis]|uniref:RNF213 n=1 Tax=Mytilus edulis TaxID=6550 RepID=A0A8S3U5G6_MYTED|nr:RNF213 [Mytilus edulis]
MNRLLIIEELMKLCIKPYNILHVDIGTIHDPYELDLFLFELIVLRHVSVGSTAYALECEKMFIEIANTVKDTLRNSLPVVTCFQRKHIEWDNYNDLKISSEINSPVQVVCHYLKAMDTATLDVKDLYFTGKNKTSTLNAMLGDEESSVKSDLFTALINTSREFSARSVHTCRSTQAATIVDVGSKDISEVLAERVAGMIRWEDSNHLVILFHQNVQTVSALYRNLKDVPKPIDYLFKRQGSSLVDFNEKSTLELEEILLLLTRRFSSTISKNQLCELRKEYALTPDNLLKMILISLRVNTRLPILIMGETGCGKTSLIRYLANICGVAFEVFSIHAGTDDHQIKERIKEASQNARKLPKNQYWLFLDEINTCDHLGLITSAICHRFCQGIHMPPNLILLAACNPYRLRKTDAIMTAGLQGLKIKTDELSRLVYRVHPLPETLIDYVWDYGSLSELDEQSYIFKMVCSLFQKSWFTELFACLLDMSQKFVRSVEINEYCVSLRDVDRCRRLVKWFNEFLEKKDSFQYSRNNEDIRKRT